MDKRKLIVLAGAAFLLNTLEEDRERKEQASKRWRRQWVRQHLMDRESQGAHRNLLSVLTSRDEDVFRNYMRMPPVLFDTLQKLVSPLITKEQTNFQASISPSKRLSLTIPYMATGKHGLSLHRSTSLSSPLGVFILLIAAILLSCVKTSFDTRTLTG